MRNRQARQVVPINMEVSFYRCIFRRIGQNNSFQAIWICERPTKVIELIISFA